ncbi:MAG: YlxR family protein [Deinococcus sp.]|uniref:YlxR family protein n=1 Tax=Deinococcus sp. TaxID=47478 RepID=UPI0026DD9E00|nr:YlxR family protein [Deinococcus sp.]MDO4246823.1 YlxR family protein [Deinococcus sp.]
MSAAKSSPETHVPERTCVACRAKRPQAELLRLVPQAAPPFWAVQQRGRTGRGLYLCPDPACWQEKGLRRAFRQQAAALSEWLRQTHPAP